MTDNANDKRVKFPTPVEEIAFLPGAAIQEWQERWNVSNKELAAKLAIDTRTLTRIKAGGACSLGALEMILDYIGYELTAQPIGANQNVVIR